MLNITSIVFLTLMSLGAAFMLWVLWKITLDLKKSRRRPFHR